MSQPFYVHFGGNVNLIVGGMIHAGVIRPSRRPRRTHPTLCGRPRGKPLAVMLVDADGNDRGAITTCWPPYVSEARRQGLERCPDCFELAPGRPLQFATASVRDL